VVAVSNFANLTLSALYFDITKDCLYANKADSVERRAVSTVLEQVLQTVTSIMAPITPHLAEEIYFHDQGANPTTDKPSFFCQPWRPLSIEWNDLRVEEEMTWLLQVRSGVLALLERARMAKQLRNSLEAEVDFILPERTEKGGEFLEILCREEAFLKTLCIVSDACITEEGSFGVEELDWVHAGSVSIPGCEDLLGIRIRPAKREKCPRCWTFTRVSEVELCDRCSDAIRD